MKVMLVFPPQAQPFMPHPAVPQLTAVLKAAGIDVVQKDYNLEAYEYHLNPDYLVKAGMHSFVAGNVEVVKKEIRTGYDYVLPSSYYNNIALLHDYLNFITDKYTNLVWNLKEYWMHMYKASSLEHIDKATVDRHCNLLIGFFEEKAKEIAAEKPDILGISVAWESQVIPAFTLARIVKKHLPGIHICMGGSMISHLADYLIRKRKMFTFVDSYMPYEGETGLVELARHLPERNLDKVPGLIYPVKKKIMVNPPVVAEKLDELPYPDFDGLPLKKYYSPQVYLPISASRGCYWGKCAFCSHHLSGSHFRQRSAQSIFDEMNEQYEKYFCKNFYFSDDALPPVLASELAALITEHEKPWRWAAELRLENMMDEEYFEKLYAGGCRLALFGLESFNQRVLDAMNKGCMKETAEKVIRAAGKSGIITWVFFFVGFPGETKEEAAETLRFILENRHSIDMVAGGRYVLARNSPVFREPGKFGITHIHANPEQDLRLAYTYMSATSASEKDSFSLLHKFKELPEVAKFMEPFVTEPHLLFFRKSYFTQKT